MKIVKKDDKMFLETQYTTGNKAWCAKITGTHPKWDFERNFLNGTRKGLKLSQVEDGDIIEEAIFSHSGKNSSRSYFVIKNGEPTKTTKRDVLLTLA